MVANHHLLHLLAKILLLIGGINWGLIGIFHFDLVGAIFGEMSVISRLIYTVVGIAAGYKIYCWYLSKKTHQS